jgi:8-amino-7-oxononanoate synthase
MGRALLHRFDAFRDALDRLERALDGETAVPLTALLYPERSQHPLGDAAAAARLTATEHCQPALVGLGAALTELLAAVGIRPDVVAGHSVGEFTAAVGAGALRSEDAVRFAARRGRAMADLDGDRGAMAAVFADRDQVSAMLGPGAVIANVNHPRQMVVSGTTAAVAAVVSAAAGSGVRAVPLDVSHGFHSPVLAGVDLSELVAGLPLSDPALPFASGILDRPVRTAADARASFGIHATSAVDFVGALDQVAAAGCDLALQVATGGPLASMARAGLRRPVVEIGPSADDGGHSFLTALGQLWTAGCDVDPRSLTRAVPPASLPPSPLPRERYWAVGDRPDFPLDRLDRAVDRPLPPVPTEPDPPAPPVAVSAAPAESGAAAAVRAALAEVSAYPVDLLTDDASLVDDLGFDSLMLASFAEELAGRVPDSVPDEALLRARTIGDLVALLEDADVVVAGSPSPAPRPPSPPMDARVPDSVGPRGRRDAFAWPEVQELAARRAAAAAAGFDDPYFRVRTGPSGPHAEVAGRDLLAFTSYDYLGLAADPRVAAAVAEAVGRYGTSVSASRVASGERPFHGELERELARAQGAESALVFTSGHATNVGVIGHLVRPGDLVVHDQLAHDSILQGVRLSGAERVAFRHDDLDHLERVLASLRARSDRCLVVVEGVYSMDGDVCRLPELVALKERYDCLLMVDEAHSFGVLGARGLGVGEHSGVPGSAVDVWMGTLSKSLASCGGWIAGSEALTTWLRYTTPGFVFSAGITPSNAQAALTALQLLRAEPERVTRLRANAAVFHARLTDRGVDTGTCRGESAVVPVITGSSAGALALGQRLFQDGIDVQPILYPAVPEDSARLRFFLSEGHSEHELRHAADLVARHLGSAH